MINYEEAAKKSVYPIFKAGTYICKIINAEHKPDNTYNGKPSPCWSLLLNPIRDIQRDAMEDSEGEVMESSFEDKDGNMRERVLFINLGLPLKLHEKSIFGKLCRAVFDTTDVSKYTFNEIEDFIGTTVTCAIGVGEKMDGTPKNIIESYSNDPKNETVSGSTDKGTAEKIMTDDKKTEGHEEAPKFEEGKGDEKPSSVMEEAEKAAAETKKEMDKEAAAKEEEAKKTNPLMD